MKQILFLVILTLSIVSCRNTVPQGDYHKYVLMLWSGETIKCRGVRYGDFYRCRTEEWSYGPAAYHVSEVWEYKRTYWKDRAPIKLNGEPCTNCAGVGS